MGIVLTDFQGELPGVSNYDLPVNAASEAINCEFGGTLRPARFFSATPDTSTAGWPVKVHGTWLNSDKPDGILPSPMTDDSVDRVYRISGGELQRARIGDLSWATLGVEPPTAAIAAVLDQPTTTSTPPGERQAPDGNQVIFHYALMYFGRGDDGKQYYSNRVEGSRVGYANSQLVLTLSDNLSQHLNTVRQQVRYSQDGFSVSPFRNSYNGIQLGLFKSDNAGGWLLVADTNAGVPADGRAVIPFGAATNGGWTYNATNVMSYSVSLYDEYGTTNTVAVIPPAPKAVEVAQQPVSGAGEASVEDIPSGEVSMSRAYILTQARIMFDAYTNEVLEESAPTDPITVSGVYSNTTVRISLSLPVPSGYVYNIYRANAGTYLYVGRINAGESSFLDSVPDIALGEPCPSLEWETPPTLDGFFMAPYGFFVGWKENRVYCSEVFLPHSWPVAYSYAIKHRIIRCVPTHNGAIAITDGGNYFLSGSSPSGMSVVEMPTMYPCIAPATAVDMGDGVVYVSPVGLAIATSSGDALLTDGSVGKKWWAAKNWSGAYAYRADTMYVLTTNTFRLVFDFKSKTIAQATGLPKRATFDQSDGSLKTPTSVVYASTFAPEFTWKSKRLEFNDPQSFSWTQCIASDYPVTVTWELKHSTTKSDTYSVIYSSSKPVRFRSGAFDAVTATISAGGEVSKLVLTANRGELEYVG